MKRFIRLGAALALAICLVSAAKAESERPFSYEDEFQRQKEELGLDSVTNSLSPDVRNALSGLGIKDMEGGELSKGLDFGRVMNLIVSAFLDRIGVNGALFVSIAGVVILLALFESLKSSYENKGFDTVFRFIGGAAICALIYQPFYGATDGVARAVDQTGVFMKALIPVFTAAMAASGHVSGAAMFSAMLFLSSQIALTMANGLMLPLVNLYMASGIAASVSGNASLKHVTAFLRSVALWGAGLLLTVFTGVMALQGIIAGAADTVAKRSVKFAVGGIPVAGSYLGEAIDTVFASVKALKSTVGVFGIIAVLLILLTPLAACAANYLIIKLGALFASVSGNAEVTQTLDVMREGFGMIFGICAFIGLMFLFSLSLAVLFTGG